MQQIGWALIVIGVVFVTYTFMNKDKESEYNQSPLAKVVNTFDQYKNSKDK